MDIGFRASPNFGPRRHGLGPDMVVLHYTGMADFEAAAERLCDPASEVSSHYLIAEDGRVLRLVPEGMRAWHAGAGSWGAVSDVNSHSIGIEISNSGPLANFPPFPEPQMAALETLLAGIFERHKIKPQNVIAHSDMAPTRKIDPGPKFDWQRLALRGVSVWPNECKGTQTPSADLFGNLAARFGYGRDNGAMASDSDTAILAAFRLRFRAGHSGALDAHDMALIAALARDYPASSSCTLSNTGPKS